MKLEISEKGLAIIVSVTLLASLIGFGLGSQYYRIGLPKKSASVKVNVYVIKETPQGQDLIVVGNVLTDIYERYIRNIAGWDNQTNHNATQWIALGNSTIDQTNTKLDTEATSTGFTRAANDSCVAWVNSGDYAYNVTNQFTATGNIWVNATALHYQSTSDSDNNMAALASLGSMENFENNWNCTITWVITYNFN